MATDVKMGGMNDFGLPPRKKPKVSELPLSSAQRSSIDGMLHTFKKKGEFDGLRKKTFQQYNESAQRGMFEASLRNFTANEIESDPVKYLKPDRRIAAPLLEGAAARADNYAQTEADIDAYIDAYMQNAERALRDIRRNEIGDDAADEEIERGNKSDEAYAAEADLRRKDRAKKFVDEEKARKKKEKQELKKKELDLLRKKQEELTKETERLQRDQKRREEREAFKAAEKEKEKERIKKFNEERERQKKEAEERARAEQEERDRLKKERAEREQKRLEEEALDLLLREGKEMADKGRRPELERSESMEPPSRLRHSSAPRNSLSKDEMRSQGLMPTSLTLRRGDKAPAIPSGPAAKDDDRARSSRPTPPPRTRRETPPRDDHDRRGSRLPPTRRESSLRDRAPSRGGGEEGEVVERAPPRPRSRSADRAPYRRRRDYDSRSPPPRRGYRDRSRSPPRRSGFRDRDTSARERSRSPAGIDRYVPGGMAPPPPKRGGREEDDRDGSRRASGRFGQREREREREAEGGKGIDRYIPGGGRAAAAEEGAEKAPRSSRRERSRSRSRVRERRAEDGERSVRRRERSRSRDRERDRERRDRDRDRDRDSRRGSTSERVR